MLGANYKTKKELKASIGKPFKYIETSLFGAEFRPDGKNPVVGPDPYRNRKWYASVICEKGLITKVS